MSGGSKENDAVIEALLDAALKAVKFFEENDIEHLWGWEDNPHLALSRAINKAKGQREGS